MIIAFLIIFGLLSGCQDDADFQSSRTQSQADAPNLEFNDASTGLSDMAKASYLVMFREPGRSNALHFASYAAEYGFHYSLLADSYLLDSRVESIDFLTTVDLGRTKNSEWEPEFTLPASLRLFWDENSDQEALGVLSRVDFKNEADAREVLSQWDQQGRLWYAEPNGRSEVFQSNIWKSYSESYSAATIKWHTQIGLVSALNGLADGTIPSPTTIDSPIIAVLDSGVDYEHPALKNQIWQNDQPGASGCEADYMGCNTTAPAKGSFGNGDVWPVGASGPGQSVEGEGRHGTHVAGIVASALDSDFGGVCPVCKIMILKVAEIDANSSNASPGITDDSQIRALKYVTRFKDNNRNVVRIVNSSFGKYTRSRSVAILIDILRKLGNGTLVVAAASNEDSMIRPYPAALANAVAVSALNSNLSKASFSNFGPWVDVAAPGVDIVSTVPGDNISAAISGTSMAAPVVAGAAGFYLALHPNASFDEIRNKIIECADPAIYTGDTDGAKYNFTNYFPLLEGESARRPLLGSGMVNVFNMLTSSSCKGAIGRPLDRVTRGCSSIGLSQAQSSIGLAAMLLLISPILSIFWRRGK